MGDIATPGGTSPVPPSRRTVGSRRRTRRTRGTEATARAGKTGDQKSDATDKASTALGAGLALFTASLGAVGGLTGGVARMFRNGSHVLVVVAFALVLLSVLLAVLARLWGRGVAAVMLTAGLLAFGFGSFIGVEQMVKSAKTLDRPALAAQMVRVDDGWVLKVQAGSSGLRATDQLQVLVYGQTAQLAPQVSPTPSGVSGQGAGGSPPASPSAGSPSPAPTVSAAPHLDGIRMFYAQAGPNADGIATETVEIPFPVNQGIHTIVVTANLGDYPRDCEGKLVNVQDNTELFLPPAVLRGGRTRRDETLSCVTLRTPTAPVPSVGAGGLRPGATPVVRTGVTPAVLPR